MKEITHRYQDSRYVIGTIATSIRTFFNLQQENGESMVLFAKRFKNAKDIMETRFGKLDMSFSLEGTEEYEAQDFKGKEKLADEAYKKLVAYQFLMGCTTDKATELRKELQNDHAKGDNRYPATLENALEMINNFRFH